MRTDYPNRHGNARALALKSPVESKTCRPKTVPRHGNHPIEASQRPEDNGAVRRVDVLKMASNDLAFSFFRTMPQPQAPQIVWQMLAGQWLGATARRVTTTSGPPRLLRRPGVHPD